MLDHVSDRFVELLHEVHRFDLALLGQPAGLALIPTPPSHRAADHGLNDAVDWPQVARELQGLNVLARRVH